jgi:hypothetical protein
MALQSFLGSAVLSALTVAGAVAAAPAPEGSAPIRLVSEPSGEGIRLRVLGASDKPLEATYLLEASGGPTGTSNKSVQRGTARLPPGVPVTLVTLTLGNTRNGSWSARLYVSPSQGDPYEMSAGSPPE